MKRNFRLTQRKDFKTVRSQGRKQKNRNIVLLSNRNSLENSRAAVVASKKIGNAVQRNRTKRVMRACLDQLWGQIDHGWDLIFYARVSGANASYHEQCLAIEDLLKKANLII